MNCRLASQPRPAGAPQACSASTRALSLRRAESSPATGRLHRPDRA
jgi:hypothetical protein